MIISQLLLFIFALTLPEHLRTSQRELDMADENIHRAFPHADRIERVSITLSDVEPESLRILTGRSHNDSILVVLLPTERGKIAGYAIIDNVMGKDQAITYLVQTTPALEVRDVSILAYRESYGGEIRNPSWLEQFFGKRPDDMMRPGKEIRNITGATISSRAVTFGVARILTLLRAVSNRLPGKDDRTR
jgi:hypothetical protein